MKQIHLIFTLAVFLTLFSCSDDNEPEVVEGIDGLVNLELTKDFLVNEKWFVDTVTAESEIDINGDGIATLILNPQFPECDLDSFYQFEGTSEDFLNLVDDGIECDEATFFDRFGVGGYVFSIDVENQVLNIELFQSELLGGLSNSTSQVFGGLRDVDFLISPDSSFKLIRGEVQLLVDNGSGGTDLVIIDYRLRADIDNRPE